MTTDPPAELLLDHARDKVVVIDEEGTVTYCNEAAREVVGYDPEELIGVDAFDLIHPDDVERVRSTFRETVEGAPPRTGDADGYAAATVEYRHRTPDGSWVWLESRFSNLTHAAVGGYVVSSRDVTDRVRAERERDETAARLEELAETATDVLWSFTGDWSEALFVNPAYESVYGGSIEEVEADATAFLEQVHPEDRPAVRGAMARLSAGEHVDVEYRVNPGRNFGRWVWVQASPIVEDGEVVRIVGFSRDVTDRKRREKQLAVIDNVLRHNLRNDLNKILGYVDEIGSDEGSPGGLSGAEDPEIEVIRQVGLDLLEKAEKQREVNRLLRSAPATRPVDLVAAVERAVETQRRRTPDARIETDLPDAATVDALPEIGDAMAELIDNAVGYADPEAEPPRVAVSIALEGDEAVVTVRDWNVPVPEYDRQVLLGKGDDDGVAHSTGLGLWLVHWVVDLSDGSARFDPPDGKGNVARVRLPLAGD
ncbi:PAS domain-containing sensor histidine kinase [Haloparvum sedimenti]|uniref:PAS domain-containing sensor histidine kinase n=1 Tax=Haloparvum sedimenti TaxID=1678448 RepID=UPI00071E9C83|nr:PAS domain-containing sensor histidine kinase [Haloparvum sedimenti]